MGLLNFLLGRKKEDIKITLIGYSGVGKTQFLKTLNNESSKTVKTYGFNLKNFKYNKSQNVIITDIGGNKDDQKYWANYYENSNGLIIFIKESDDIDDSIKLLKRLLLDKLIIYQPILLFINNDNDSKAFNKDFILIYSKILNEYSTEERNWMVVEGNCLSGKGINESISWLIFNCNKLLFK